MRGGARLRFGDLPVRCRILLMFLSIGVLGMAVESSVLVLYQRHALEMEAAREGGATMQSLGANVARPFLREIAARPGPRWMPCPSKIR